MKVEPPLIAIKEAPMSRFATPSRRRVPARRKARTASLHASQTRRTRRRDRKRRQRLAHKARVARRKLEQIQQAVPEPARSLFDSLAGAFTRPTFLRFVVLALAAILTVGARNICNLLRYLRCLAPGHPSSYHRILSKPRWSPWRLARVLAASVVER